MSVLPSAAREMFCTTMSMSISASAMQRKIFAATPGWSGTAVTVTLASPRSCATPVIRACSTVRSSMLPSTMVPSLSLYEERDVHRDAVAAGVLDAAQHQHLRAGRRHLEHLLVGDGVELRGVGHDPRVGGEDAVDVGVDLADVGVQRGGQRDRGGVRAAAAQGGDVLGVLADALETGDDRDVRPRPGRSRIRPGVTSMIRALPWAESVMTPACDPVNDRASAPSAEMAIATSALEIRSPEVSSMSSSRAGGDGDDLLGEVDQLVGGVAHRRDDDDDVVAVLAGRRRSARRRA